MLGWAILRLWSPKRAETLQKGQTPSERDQRFLARVSDGRSWMLPGWPARALLIPGTGSTCSSAQAGGSANGGKKSIPSVVRIDEDKGNCRRDRRGQGCRP
jgi:hypothetical protein